MPDTQERLWIKNPLASFDGLAHDAADGGVVIEGNRIAEVLAKGAQPAGAVDETLDAASLVLMPGLINTHHHFYQTLTRAARDALNKPLFSWLTSLYPIWAGLTPEMVDASTELACAELLTSGCTTTVDHHYVFSERLIDAIDHQVEAASRSGIRTVLTRGSMSLGEADGGLPPDTLIQTHDTILADSERLIARYHDGAPGAMCQIALAPCSPFSVTAELMRDTAALARARDVLLHTHLAETPDETEFCENFCGKRPLDYLAELGWLDGRAWFAHGIYFTSEEIRRLGAAGCGVAHCPTSNMTLASGMCPVAELENAGVSVGLGVDGSASNDASNMIQEVRQSLLIQRLRRSTQPGLNGPLVSHLDALRWATRGGASLLHRAELGRLEAGAAADVALFSLDELRFSGSDDPLAALVLGGAHRAAHVMVDGVWRVRNGALVDADEQTLRERHSRLARELVANV